MAKASPAFTNFTAGELSPRLDGRTDLSKYLNGVKKMENLIVHPHGGASRRPGTKFVREVKNSAHNCRLIPFEFNVTQAYILEFGNEYFRIHKDGGTVVDGSSDPIEVTTPYGEDELADLKFTQSADVMYLVHPLFAPRKITRTSHTAWSIAEVAFERGPMQDDNTGTVTFLASGRTGNVNVTASSSTFVSTDVGRLIKVHDGVTKITSLTSATVVATTVQENADGRSELMPSYTAATISAHEGDPSSTGLEHNDRYQDTAGQFIAEGFKEGQKITVTGFTTGNNNNSSAIIVKVTEDTLLLAPSADVTDEAAGDSVTIAGDLTASTEWALGAFSGTTGFPSAVAFYEQRLVFASTTAQPQTLFFSVGGSFEDFNGGVNDTDALTYTLGSNQVNIIRYLQAGRVLLVGTSGGEFVVSSSEQAPLSPTNASVKRQATYGSANIQPVQVANTTLFIQRAKRKLRELIFDLNTDSYQAPDLTILAEHITEGGIKEMALQQEPDNIVWCVRIDGKLVGMTYRREENVIAWHEHTLGGKSGACTVTVSDYANIAVGTTLKFTKSDGTTVTFTSEAAGGSAPADTSLGFRPNESNNTTADNIFTRMNAHADFTVANPSAAIVTIEETNPSATGFLSCFSSDTTRLTTTNQTHALIESIATIPGDLNEDAVYMVVQRTINLGTKRYIEFFAPFDFGSSAEDAFFVDSGLSYTGTAATSMSGLNHLEGEVVSTLVNGATHPNKAVASGALTLDFSATKAHIGLLYKSTLQTMRIEAGGTEGTAQGKTKRIHEVVLRLFRTIGAKVGSSETELDRIPFRTSADEMDQSLGLFTGDKQIEFRSGFDSDGFIVVQQDQPLPLTVIGIYPRLITYDQ
tara:strand:+ start:387 stop:2981 length:2595 start_codon:yes stop_codon:yes gene_type:complete